MSLNTSNLRFDFVSILPFALKLIGLFKLSIINFIDSVRFSIFFVSATPNFPPNAIAIN